MTISVVLCKINEEINYVSIFHNHVVRIWLRNRPAKLSWNRYKNSQLQMLCLEYISPEGTFCDTVQVPSGAGDMQLI